jgi:phosphopantetheine adenylyltransferase
MKRAILSFLSIILISAAVKAQNGIEIYESGQSTDYSGDTIFITAASGVAFDVPLDVHNSTGTTHAWRVTRLRIDVPSGWSDFLCWGHSTDAFGGTCFAATQMPTNPWTTPGTQQVLFDIADGEYGKLKVSIETGSSYGTGHYRYYISDNGVSYSDSVDLFIDFTASIKQVKEEVTVNVQPNPASDYAIITLNNADNGTIRIVDVLGNVVSKETISGTKKIDLSNFRNGVYFITIETSNGKTINRKLIVKH